MIAEFAAGIAGLKTVADLTALVLKMNVDTAVKQKAEEANFAIINAQTLMLELQAKHHELLGQKDELKQRLVEMEDWNIKAAQYELTEVASGVCVYAFKTNEESSTPAHWLCSGCYQQRKTGILHKTGGATHLCPLCQTTFRIHGSPGERI